MLAYYTSLIKREDLLQKLVDDGKSLSTISNDLVCELKSFIASCESRDLETSLDKLKEAEELSKIVNAMISNLKGNYESYVSSLVEKQEPKENTEKPTEKQNQSPVEPNQMTTLLEALKTLKDVKDSMDK